LSACSSLKSTKIRTPKPSPLLVPNITLKWFILRGIKSWFNRCLYIRFRPYLKLLNVHKIHQNVRVFSTMQRHFYANIFSMTDNGRTLNLNDIQISGFF
jgi:hypothetical protein